MSDMFSVRISAVNALANALNHVTRHTPIPMHPHNFTEVGLVEPDTTAIAKNAHQHLATNPLTAALVTPERLVINCFGGNNNLLDVAYLLPLDHPKPLDNIAVCEYIANPEITGLPIPLIYHEQHLLDTLIDAANTIQGLPQHFTASDIAKAITDKYPNTNPQVTEQHNSTFLITIDEWTADPPNRVAFTVTHSH